MIGFNANTIVSDCNKFAPDITDKMVNGELSVEDAIDSISYAGYINNMSYLAVIAGNANKKIR